MADFEEKIKIVDYKIEKTITIFTVENLSGKQRDVSIKNSSIPILFGINSDPIIYPKNILRKICEAFVDKEIIWKSKSDQEVLLEENVQHNTEKKIEIIDEYAMDEISKSSKGIFYDDDEDLLSYFDD